MDWVLPKPGKEIYIGHGSVSRKDHEFLTSVSNVKKILEIGTGSGYSTTALSKHGAVVHTVDEFWHNPQFNEPVHFYNIPSEVFWQRSDERDFDLYFVDARLGPGDVEELYARASNQFMVVWHDYKQYDKGWYNHKLMIRYVFERCHTTDIKIYGSACGMFECEKL